MPSRNRPRAVMRKIAEVVALAFLLSAPMQNADAASTAGPVVSGILTSTTQPNCSYTPCFVPDLLSKSFPANLTNTVVLIQATPGDVGVVQCYNPNATEIVIQFFNVSAASSVTLGTTTPYMIVPIAGTSVGTMTASAFPVSFSNGIAVAATTTSSGSTAPAVLPDCNVLFR